MHHLHPLIFFGAVDIAFIIDGKRGGGGFLICYGWSDWAFKWKWMQMHS